MSHSEWAFVAGMLFGGIMTLLLLALIVDGLPWKRPAASKPREERHRWQHAPLGECGKCRRSIEDPIHYRLLTVSKWEDELLRAKR